MLKLVYSLKGNCCIVKNRLFNYATLKRRLSQNKELSDDISGH